MKHSKLKSLLFALPAFALVGCAASANGDKSSNLTPGNTPSLGGSNESALLMSQAVMGLDMLSSSVSAPKIMAKQVSYTPTGEAALADEIFSYIEDFDSIIGYNPSTIEVLESDDADYETLYSLTLEGEEYRLYFNKVAEHTEVDRDDHEEEITEYTRYEGVAYKGEQSFDFIGHHEVETEGREVEDSMEFIFQTDRKNYISFTQESENDENEYELELVQNGRTVMEKEFGIEIGRNGSIEVSFEIEENGKEKEIEILKTTQNGATVYLIEIEQRGESLAKVKEEARDDGTYLVLEFVGGGTYERLLA